jgi:hypothetical protein
MEVIVRLQDRALCASITCITGTYAEPEGRVIFDHRHNAAMGYIPMIKNMMSDRIWAASADWSRPT